MSLKATLGNSTWLDDNRAAMLDLFPKTWTLMSNFNVLRFGFGLKLLGVDWRSYDELTNVLVFCERAGLLLRDGLNIRRAT